MRGRDPVNGSPIGLDGAKEELGTVGVGAGIGHGKDARALVLELAAHVNIVRRPSSHAAYTRIGTGD